MRNHIGEREGFQKVSESLWDTKRMVRDHCDKKHLVIFYCCYDDGKEVWRWMVLKGNFKQMTRLARTWDWRGSDFNLRVNQVIIRGYDDIMKGWQRMVLNGYLEQMLEIDKDLELCDFLKKIWCHLTNEMSCPKDLEVMMMQFGKRRWKFGGE